MLSFAPLNQLVTRFQIQIRASSLIVTLYGDAIESHGGTVCLGSLIQLLEPYGINDATDPHPDLPADQRRLVERRESRPAQQLQPDRTGRRRFDKAFKRVYGSVVPEWDGTW